MITRILKGTFNDPSISWMHGRSCVAISHENIAMNSRRITYFTEQQGEGQYLEATTDDIHPGLQLKLNDDFTTVFDSEDKSAKLGEVELRVGEPLTIQSLLGTNLKSLTVEFK